MVYHNNTVFFGYKIGVMQPYTMVFETDNAENIEISCRNRDHNLVIKDL
jgi:hypothetical protein